MNNEEVEKAIEEKGLTAPRIKLEDLNNEILAVQYHVFPGTTLTVCAITLKNGFIVTGESAAASPENFDKELGISIAYDKAFDKIWPLLGFRLRDQLQQEK